MRATLIVFAMLSLFACGCSDDGTSPRDRFAIGGTLTDAEGDPVEGAAVVLDYEFRQLPLESVLKATAELPEPVGFRLVITDACGDEVYLDSDLLAPDARMDVIQWQGTDLEGRQAPEGAYLYRVEAEGREPVERVFCLALNMDGGAGSFGEDAAEIRATWRLDAVTDADGRFTLGRTCWSFGHTDEWVDETGTVTGDLLIPYRARLWFYPEGADRGTSGPWVDIDPVRGGVLDFALPPAR